MSWLCSWCADGGDRVTAADPPQGARSSLPICFILEKYEQEQKRNVAPVRCGVTENMEVQVDFTARYQPHHDRDELWIGADCRPGISTKAVTSSILSPSNEECQGQAGPVDDSLGIRLGVLTDGRHMNCTYHKRNRSAAWAEVADPWADDRETDTYDSQYQ
jgi:hypothetical protein